MFLLVISDLKVIPALYKLSSFLVISLTFLYFLVPFIGSTLSSSFKLQNSFLSYNLVNFNPTFIVLNLSVLIK